MRIDPLLISSAVETRSFKLNATSKRRAEVSGARRHSHTAISMTSTPTSTPTPAISAICSGGSSGRSRAAMAITLPSTSPGTILRGSHNSDWRSRSR